MHSERSLYREVLVYENGDVRCMCFTRNCRIGRQSCMDMRQPDRIVMNYPQMMLGALFVKPEPQSVLIIGLGGGTIPRALRELLPEAQHRRRRDRSGGRARRAAAISISAQRQARTVSSSWTVVCS